MAKKVTMIGGAGIVGTMLFHGLKEKYDITIFFMI